MDHLYFQCYLFINSVEALSVSESLDINVSLDFLALKVIQFTNVEKVKCVSGILLLSKQTMEKEPFYKLGEGHTKCASRLDRGTFIARTLIRIY